MQSFSPTELKNKLLQGEDIMLIDVREIFEHQNFNIGVISIPLHAIFDQKEKFENNKPIVVYCQKGIRSQIAIQRLQQKFGFNHLINLQGGMDAWKKTIVV